MFVDRTDRVAFLALCASLWLAYQASFENSFHYDDIHSIVDNPHIRELANIPLFFADPGLFSAMPERAMYRPLLLVSYAINYALSGYEVFAYHLVNWLIHLGAAWLVYLLGRRLHGQRQGALAGALIFALHPLAAEPVNYISSRSESLAALFYLTAFWGYVRWREGGAPGMGFVALAAYACGILTKSVAIVLPMALLAYERWGAVREHRKRFWLLQGGFWALTGLYLLLARSWLNEALRVPVRDWGEQWATQAKAALYYASLVVSPIDLSVEHPFSVAQSWGEAPVVLALAALASAAWLLWRRPLAMMVAIWIILPLLPASLMPLNVLVNEHRLYLPLAFLGIGLGWMLKGVSSRRARIFIALSLVIGAAMSHQRTLVWKSEFSLWSDAARQAPGMYRAQLHLGGALEAMGRVEEALACYDRAAAASSSVVEVHYNRGNALRQLGRRDAAIAAYRQSLEIEPRFLSAQLNLAALYQDLGQIAAAETLLEEAVALHPESADAWRRLGVLRRRQGDLGAAEIVYLRALALDQSLAETHYNLGNLYRDSSRPDEALQAYLRAIRLQPNHVGGHRNLGDLYLERGEYQAAVEVWGQALRHLPGEVIFYYGMGQALEALNQIAAAVKAYRRYLQNSHLNPQQAADFRRHIEELEARLR